MNDSGSIVPPRRLIQPGLLSVLSLIVLGITFLTIKVFATDDSTAPVSIDDLKRSLILYYNFDKAEPNGKVTDLSGHGNDGQAVGAHWTPNGQRGGGMEFGPVRNYITVPNNDSINPPQFTLSVWIKTSYTDSVWRRIFDKGYNTEFALSMSGNIGNKSYQGQVCFESLKGDVSAGKNMADGLWHHVVATSSGTELRLYFDGELVGKPSKATPTINKFDLTIGANHSNPNAALGEVEASFNGTMDDVMMFNRVLTAKEVKALYNLQHVETAASKPAAPISNQAEPNAPNKRLDWPADIGTSHISIAESPGVTPRPGTWIRPHPGPFFWGDVESTPGHYDWSRIDAQVLQWQSQRLAILATIWPFADWDEKAGHAHDPVVPSTAFPPELPNHRYAPHDWNAYAAWVKALVERYDGDGVHDMPGLQYPIRNWEILNEPEMNNDGNAFFQDTPEAYLKLLKISYQTIKQTDPHASVLLGGQSGINPSSLDKATEFWKPVLAGARSSFDLGNIHSLGASETFFGPEYRKLLDQFGYQKSHFWITEARAVQFVPSGQPPLSDDQRARSVLTGFATSFAAGADVIFFFQGGPGAQYPFSQVIQNTADLLADSIGNFKSVKAISASSVRFDMPDGSTVYALWNGASLPGNATGTLEVVSYDGMESQEKASGIVANKPILVFLPATPGTSVPLNPVASNSPSNPRLAPNGLPNQPMAPDPVMTGPGNPRPAPSGGPSNQRVVLATSRNGLDWTVGKDSVAEKASVPTLFLGPNGQLMMLYVTGDRPQQRPKPGAGGIKVPSSLKALVRQADGTWQSLETNLHGVDPTVVRLSDGSYRAYTKAGVAAGIGSTGAIEAFSSADGLDWSSLGEVFHDEHYPQATDPDVFETPSGWVLLVSLGPQLLLCTSTDGLHFTADKTLALGGAVSDTVKVSGGWRTYFHVNGTPQSGSKPFIRSAFTSDGKTWNVEAGNRVVAPPDGPAKLGLEAPGVVQLPDGSWIMAVCSHMVDPSQAKPISSDMTGDQLNALGNLRSASNGPPNQPMPLNPAINSPAGLQTNPNSPWNKRVVLATSKNGLDWILSTSSLVERASSPSLYVGPNGQPMLLYTGPGPEPEDPKNPKPNQDVLMRRIDGSWQTLQYHGLAGADPTVVRLSNGSYRAYTHNMPGVGHKLEAFASTDGLNWSSLGTVFQDEHYTNAGDPDVFETPSGWVLLVSLGPQLLRCTSADGLHFTADKMLALGGAVSNTVKVSGGWRTYFHVNGSPQNGGKTLIRSAFTSDGKTWNVEAGNRVVAPPDGPAKLGVEAPGVVQLPDGSWIMAVCSHMVDSAQVKPSP